MISLNQCRRIDPKLKNIPDEILQKVLEQLYGFAEFGIEDLFNNKCGSKNPIGVVPGSKGKSKIGLWKNKRQKRV